MAERSTPLCARKSSASLPKSSRAARLTKPTFVPKDAKLCARIAAELPSVTWKADAKSSRSAGIASGMPSRTISRLSSPAMATSRRGGAVIYSILLPAGAGMIASPVQGYSSEDGVVVDEGEWFCGFAGGAWPARHLLGLLGAAVGLAGSRGTGCGGQFIASDRGHLQSGQPGWRLYRHAAVGLSRIRAWHRG